MDKNIPEYNRIDYENDDLGVQKAKIEAIKQQENETKAEKKEKEKDL